MEDMHDPFLSSRDMDFIHSDNEGAGVHYLKKPAPLNKIVRCYMDVTYRCGRSPSFELWHGVPPRHVRLARCVDNDAAVRVKGTFLLAARRRQLLTSSKHTIYLDPNKSKGAVAGKLESNFLNTKYTLYDSQSPHTGAVPSNKTTTGSHIRSSKGSRRGHSTSFKAVANISYEVEAGLPCDMECSLLTIPASVMDSNKSARSTSLDFLTTALNDNDSPPSFGLGGSSKSKIAEDDGRVAGFHSRDSALLRRDGPLVLNKKLPQWNGKQWIMAKFPPHPVTSGLPTSPNFLPPWLHRLPHLGEVNFQVVAVSSNQTSSQIEEIVLHFHECGESLYILDYLYPLSAFQAFAICLSYFEDRVLATLGFGRSTNL